jgi:5-methylcytosine-specific restriction endonuclease McrA
MPMMPPTFKPLGHRSEKEARREQDRRRGSARERGYSSRWDKASLRFLRRNPVCRCCRARGKPVPSKVTDHIVPHGGDQLLFWDEHNWQPACKWCHDVVKQILERLFAAGEIGADDLRLDSPRAIRVAVEQQGLALP